MTEDLAPLYLLNTPWEKGNCRMQIPEKTDCSTFPPAHAPDIALERQHLKREEQFFHNLR